MEKSKKLWLYRCKLSCTSGFGDPTIMWLNRKRLNRCYPYFLIDVIRTFFIPFADCEHLFSSENNFKFLGTNGPETSTVFDRNNTDVILPTHLLNIFIPLVDVDHTNGGTEICPGSHFQTKVFDDNINWQSPEKANEMGYAGKGVVPKVSNFIYYLEQV